MVVDEVQDFTIVQLRLLLQQTLRQPGDFLLCGDANQIVHPNFFSWSKLKSLFFEERGLAGEGETLRILHANYRNSPLVTAVANRILKLKRARFGSVDRESDHLVDSRGGARRHAAAAGGPKFARPAGGLWSTLAPDKQWVVDLPESMVPVRRKRRPCISSVLPGNEVDRDAPCNRKPFKRVSHGNYVVDPALRVRLTDEWVGVHELLCLEDLGIEPPGHDGFPVHSDHDRRARDRLAGRQHVHRERRLDAFKADVRRMADG